MNSEKLSILYDLDIDFIDQKFFKIHDQVFENYNCLTCANCCKNHSPIIEPEEISRLVSAIGVDSQILFERYIEMDEEGDFVFRMQPCPMLDLDTNKCKIYSARPKACSEYPHTNMKKIKNHLDLLEKNIEICPAANLILENVLNEIENDKN